MKDAVPRVPAGSLRLPGRQGRCAAAGARGFTIIELMVVIAIIILAAGIMTPTLTDYFRNRRLEGIRGQFGSAFNSARLDAVNNRVRVSLVFFREGVRKYDERDGQFTDDFFNPETSSLGGKDIWYELGFRDKLPSTRLPRFREWERATAAALKAAADAAGRQASGAPIAKPRIPVHNLPRLTFERDGTLLFTTGVDVSTSAFQKDIPDGADVVIYQAGNSTACFIDFRPTGQIRSKTVPMPQASQRPPEIEGAATAGALAAPAEAPEPPNEGRAQEKPANQKQAAAEPEAEAEAGDPEEQAE